MIDPGKESYRFQRSMEKKKEGKRERNEAEAVVPGAATVGSSISIAGSNPIAFQAMSFQPPTARMEECSSTARARTVFDVKYHFVWWTASTKRTEQRSKTSTFIR